MLFRSNHNCIHKTLKTTYDMNPLCAAIKNSELQIALRLLEDTHVQEHINEDVQGQPPIYHAFEQCNEFVIRSILRSPYFDRRSIANSPLFNLDLTGMPNIYKLQQQLKTADLRHYFNTRWFPKDVTRKILETT